MKHAHVYAIIMAGGVGERFWPQSRQSSPKQLLDLTGSGLSMLALTVQRLQPLISPECIYVITNEQQKESVLRAVPQIHSDQVIGEPVGRNTAACVGLGARVIQEKDPDAIMLVLPADHHIEDVLMFQKTLDLSIKHAENNQLVTIGMTAIKPETEYGYIQSGIQIGEEPFKSFQVKAFKEKPSRELAEEFLNEGAYYWNSGMFAWKASVILEEMQSYVPELYEDLIQLNIRTLEGYDQLESLPIDIAVMEQSERAVMVEGTFDWNDLGLWTSVKHLYDQSDAKGNQCAQGDCAVVDAARNFTSTDEGVVGLIGVDDLIVVRDRDAVLVCQQSHAKDVKVLVQKLRNSHKDVYL